jgi:lipopolysaccharide transport system permease protein
MKDATVAAPGSLWSRRDLVWQLARRNLRRRYRGHLFGPLWPFLNPLAQLAIYTLVFSVFLRADYSANPDWVTGPGWTGHLRYALIAYAGLVPYSFFTDVAANASGLVRREPNFVKKMVFPVEALAPVQLLTVAVEAGAGMGLILAAQAFLGFAPTWTWMLLPLALLPLLLLSLAAAWALSAVGAYVPDLQELVTMVLRVLFFLTPIVYPIEVVPASMRTFVALNPLASILHGIRNVVLFGRPLIWESWFVVTSACAALAVLSWLLFRRLRPGFADVV